MPVVLVPVDPDNAIAGPTTRRSIAIRTFLTNDFMTGRPAIPGAEVRATWLPPRVFLRWLVRISVVSSSHWPAFPSQMPLDVLNSMVAEIQALPNVARVMYDLTAKPPGTTEWE